MSNINSAKEIIEKVALINDIYMNVETLSCRPTWQCSFCVGNN